MRTSQTLKRVKIVATREPRLSFFFFFHLEGIYPVAAMLSFPSSSRRELALSEALCTDGQRVTDRVTTASLPCQLSLLILYQQYSRSAALVDVKRAMPCHAACVLQHIFSGGGGVPWSWWDRHRETAPRCSAGSGCPGATSLQVRGMNSEVLGTGLRKIRLG